MKRVVLGLGAGVVFLGVLATGYFLSPRGAEALPLPVASAGARDTAVAVNSFGIDLYSQVRVKEGNVCLSPYSLHTALAMSYEGASGKTAEQMAAVLHLTDAGRAGQRDLHVRLRAPGYHGFELAIANRLWLGKQAAVLPAFGKRLADEFFADVATVDFGNPSTVAAVNRWTAEQTRQRIPSLLSGNDVSALTVLVLTNALYFKGNWDEPFKASATAEGDFFPGPGQKMRTQFMRQTEDHDFAQFGEEGAVPAFRALSMGYTGGDLSMLLLLPELGKLEALEAGLSVELLEKIVKGLHETKLPVTLPRFSMTDGYSLVETLQAMGMKDAFEPGRADFGGMSATPLFVQTVVHKTFIQVNEEGTEAAAASAVAAGEKASMPEVPPEFHADHPFLFIVRDRGTGVMLFIGRVRVPETAGS